MCLNRRKRLPLLPAYNSALVCSHLPLFFILCSCPVAYKALRSLKICACKVHAFDYPTPIFEEIVEHNFKASRVCDPTIVDVRLIPMGNVESDPGRGHLGRRPDLRRRGWRMCWFGREDQTCSTRNRIADTRFHSSCFVLYSSLEGYWLDRVHLSQIFLISRYTAAR